MHCYEVWVASNSFKGKKPLWYLFKKQLLPGAIVQVPLRSKNVFGFIALPSGKSCTLAKNKLLSGIEVENYSLAAGALELHEWLLHYYGNSSGATTALFLPGFLTLSGLQASLVSQIDKSEILAEPPLTNQQQKDLTTIRSAESGTFLIHGVTGSGKTRIYIEMIRQKIIKNQSVIVLTPEIGLTPQLEKNIRQAIKNCEILITNSNQTPKRRREVWAQCNQSKKPIVLIGPRSALFFPLDNIGLIVIDEEHDDSYKQSQSPYYHAVRVASKLAIINRAHLLLGSATPSINDVFLAEQKGAPMLELTKTALPISTTSSITMVDINDRSHFVRSRHISEQLLDGVLTALNNHKQALIFLNRRGSSRLIACTQCNWEAICNNCDLPYTYHKSANILRCHTCGKTDKVPTCCPTCRSTEIFFSIPGTEYIESELNKLFPQTIIARFDTDVATSEKLEKNYERLRQHKIDIIVGTQMLVKGFDLPNLGFVGIINADSSLAFPDYTTEEKTYQLLVQAIGRVNRGHTSGTVVIQTRQPDSSTIIASTINDWSTFYKSQLLHRKSHNLPPYAHILKLKCRRSSEKSAINSAEKLKTNLKKMYPSTQIIGPTPAFKQKINNQYVWQLILKTSNRQRLIQIIEALPSGWSYDIDPLTLL